MPSFYRHCSPLGLDHLWWVRRCTEGRSRNPGEGNRSCREPRWKGSSRRHRNCHHCLEGSSRQTPFRFRLKGKLTSQCTYPMRVKMHQIRFRHGRDQSNSLETCQFESPKSNPKLMPHEWKEERSLCWCFLHTFRIQKHGIKIGCDLVNKTWLFAAHWISKGHF